MGIVGCESAAAVHDAAAALVARARRAAQVAHSSQGLSLIDARCNAVERSVLHQLKRCLEDVDIDEAQALGRVGHLRSSPGARYQRGGSVLDRRSTLPSSTRCAPPCRSFINWLTLSRERQLRSGGLGMRHPSA